MRKAIAVLIAIGFVLGISGVAQAGVLVTKAYEGFDDYAAGTNLTSTGADGGWSTGWGGVGTTIGTFVVQSPDLTNGAFTSAGQTATGGRAYHTAFGAYDEISRGLVDSVDLGVDATYYFTWTTAWMSNSPSMAASSLLFLGNKTTYFGLFGSGLATSTSIYENRMIPVVRLSGATTYDQTTLFPTFYPAAQNYFLVARIAASATGDDTLSLKVYTDTDTPTPENYLNPATWTVSVTTQSDAVYDSLGIKGRHWYTVDGMWHDEVTYLSDVIPVPEPAGLGLIGLGLLALKRRRRS